jgi:hypothetical protein
VKGAKKPQKYINLTTGILALVIAACDILTSGVLTANERSVQRMKFIFLL